MEMLVLSMSSICSPIQVSFRETSAKALGQECVCAVEDKVEASSRK